MSLHTATCNIRPSVHPFQLADSLDLMCPLQADLLEPLRFAARPDLCLVFFTSATPCGSITHADCQRTGPVLSTSVFRVEAT